ncbi:shikimate kinase AroL [Photorhabdus laumondii subsp. laumondii]|uniref:Shikimate kinase 2 n=2 Tax=Photorhabdus laumondii subsp. laumondii TaxID=141679 RepID=AROL_PHOLL|nr:MULTISPECIES: shikimate kinase AroL [Photorhabdus]Q7N7B0.1 RecName: Full=Shikimate kinase 2; Short=SK 2 [Photorhabdus laumondii subsp. laumondii TTO1]NHB62997.1 shikimate kinase [Photorhabdus sp. RW14-46]AWK41131.1 shikimate kinase II [Photorhabdus laumondii subsp. laumondii]AXG41869.1 shikimate kinase [Photorhabdus laumondii subsp. laumondii]AXG46456.1 shikimate kinase [Photorhabdus laumondii subsp. laumondii]KTL60515.1 shikimate kinase [Photorhabdus laumondii subsp. laumondii]
MNQILFIVGARGAGKTTVGKLLANELSYTFIDTDHHIQQTSNMTIADIVNQQGWQQFRQLESQALQQVTQINRVISTGGGIILSAENRQYMRQNGTVIYLQASASILAERLMQQPESTQRPSLTGKSIVEEMEEVLAARENLYCECANHIINAHLSPEKITTYVKEIMFSGIVS